MSAAMAMPVQNTFVHFQQAAVLRRTKSLSFDFQPVEQVAEKKWSRMSVGTMSTMDTASVGRDTFSDIDSLCDVPVADTRSTVIIRNIPNMFTPQGLQDRLQELHRGEFNFFYLPMDTETSRNLGYAFVNFQTPAAAARFIETFAGTKLLRRSGKRVSVEYSRLQGYQRHLEQFRQVVISKLGVMGSWSPMVFHNGKRFAFPTEF